jgi:hypothetical protein
VDYELTQLGQTLRGALVPLHVWAAKNRETISNNRIQTRVAGKNANHREGSGETAASGQQTGKAVYVITPQQKNKIS